MSAILVGHTEPMIEIELVRWAISRGSDIRRCHGYRSENARVLPRTNRTKRTSVDREHKLYGGGKKKSREGQRRSRAQRPRSDWRPTPPPFRQHPNHRAHATDKERLSSASGAIEKAATRGATSGTRQRVGIGWLVGRRATLR